MVRLVLLGDSNTSGGYDGTGALVASGYLEDDRVLPTDAHSPYQLSGIVEAAWNAAYPTARITVVNHAIGGTNTGVNTNFDMPCARTAVNGVTRFEAEVMGLAPGWTYNAIPRVLAAVPGSQDFAYVSLGTNDCRYGIDYATTIVNLRWMAETWTAGGHKARHFLLATIPPVVDTPGCGTLGINAQIRSLCTELGLSLIDLGAHTTTTGTTWINAATMCLLADGSNVHYTPAVRTWIAGQITAAMASAPSSCSITAHNH